MPQQPQQPVDIGLGLKIFPSKTVAEARADLDEQELAKQDREITRMKLADYVEQRNAQRAKAQEDQEFNAFLTDASQKFTQKDGSPDDDRILIEVSKRYPARAPALKAIVLKQRKDAIDAYKVSLDNDKAEHDADLQRLQQMGNPQAYAAFYPALKDPYLKQYLGPQFDETTPTKIKAMYDAGLSEKDRLDRQRQTADLYDKNPHLAFLRNLSDDTDEEMPHTIAAARRLIPDAVDAFLEELQPNQPGVQQRAKALAEVLTQTTDKADKPVFAVDPTKHTLTQVGTVPAGSQILQQPQPPAASNPDAAADKSYSANKTRLDGLRKTFTDAIPRMDRLIETVNQASPQADALVAPELLTVMAGGMGSGLRMNEAEISRIIGGRSKYEDIKAALNKWQTDPSKALSITASQRQDIRKLIDAVRQKSAAKLDLIQEADAKLLEAKTVKEQRQIIIDLQKSLEDFGGGGAGEVSVKGKDGVTYKFPNQAAADAFKKAGG